MLVVLQIALILRYSFLPVILAESRHFTHEAIALLKLNFIRKRM